MSDNPVQTHSHTHTHSRPPHSHSDSEVGSFAADTHQFHLADQPKSNDIEAGTQTEHVPSNEPDVTTTESEHDLHGLIHRKAITILDHLRARTKRILRWLAILAYWLVLLIPLGCLIGVAAAFFLYSIDLVTKWRFSQPWLLYLLPVSGLIQGLIYSRWSKHGLEPGSTIGYGVDLIIDQVHRPHSVKARASVPWRMGWMAWIGTCLSHLCGASVGREGTGLQIAASISGWYIWCVRYVTRGRVILGKHTIRLMTIASMAAGFGSVFGTPFGGVIFSLEVLVIGPILTEALIPCIIASCTADIVSTAMLEVVGIDHSRYLKSMEELSHPHVRIEMVLLICVAATFFGIVARGFSKCIYLVQHVFRALIPSAYKPRAGLIIPTVGSGLVILLVVIWNTRDYLGIGTIRPSGDTDTVIIGTCFSTETACHDYSFVAKWIFTVVSLAIGFKGGEVTSLFFIGASCGYAVAQWLNVSGDTQLFASIGFVSVFGAAANTPLASTVMACELFGGTHVIYYAIGCYVAYAVSGQSGIYHAQLREQKKLVSYRTARNQSEQEHKEDTSQRPRGRSV